MRCPSSAADLLTKDEARCIAANIARLPGAERHAQYGRTHDQSRQGMGPESTCACSCDEVANAQR
jgi:hypothetical protein